MTHAEKHRKSAMYGPTGCCRRKRRLAKRLERSAAHNRSSVGVACRRWSRAASQSQICWASVSLSPSMASSSSDACQTSSEHSERAAARRLPLTRVRERGAGGEGQQSGVLSCGGRSCPDPRHPRSLTLSPTDLLSRASAPTPIVVSGPMGSELVSRGVRWRGHGMLTDADAVRDLYAEYLNAGCDVLR